MRIRNLVSTAAVIVAAAGAITPVTAADAVTAGPALAVDITSGRHTINPDIYGMNFADPALATELGLTADRWGGNSASR